MIQYTNPLPSVLIVVQSVGDFALFVVNASRLDQNDDVHWSA